MPSKHYVHAVLTVVASLWLASTALGASTYTPDPTHTTVGFTARHFVITKVTGRFNDYTATIMYDENDITKSSMQGIIKTASLNTGNERRDANLRSTDFFDVEKFPEIKFHSTRVEKQGEGYVLIGPLTIRDVTREVAIPFMVTGKLVDRGKERIGFEASLKINRKDFGMTWDKRMDNGGLIASDQIDIELFVEAIKNQS
jgi:polyisoprenoid-binding protein YceI